MNKSRRNYITRSRSSKKRRETRRRRGGYVWKTASKSKSATRKSSSKPKIKKSILSSYLPPVIN